MHYLKVIIIHFKCHSLHAEADWMRSNRLQLNSDKTEFIWCDVPVRRQHYLLTVGPFIGSSTVKPYSAIRDLGVYRI